MASSRRTTTLSVVALLLAGAGLSKAQVWENTVHAMPSGAFGGMHSGGQGYLGVSLRGIGDPSLSNLHLKESHGVVVIMVDHDGPAWQAGVREHDVILSVNGTNAESEDQLRHLLRELHAGQPVQITISRDGTQQSLTATMANGDELAKKAWKDHWVVPAPSDVAANDNAVPPPTPARPPRGFVHGFAGGHLLPQFGAYTGVMVNEIEPQLAEFFGLKGCKGLLVQSVDTNSPAATAGLHAGDVVTKLNGTAVSTRSDWNKALHDSKGHPVSITVMRDHHEQVLVMVPDAKRRSSLEMEHPADEPKWSALVLVHSPSI